MHLPQFSRPGKCSVRDLSYLRTYISAGFRSLTDLYMPVQVPWINICLCVTRGSRLVATFTASRMPLELRRRTVVSYFSDTCETKWRQEEDSIYLGSDTPLPRSFPRPNSNLLARCTQGSDLVSYLRTLERLTLLFVCHFQLPQLVATPKVSCLLQPSTHVLVEDSLLRYVNLRTIVCEISNATRCMHISDRRANLSRGRT